MYTVTLIRKNKKYASKFNTEREACAHARAFFHLLFSVTDPNGKPVLLDGCIDSEY